MWTPKRIALLVVGFVLFLAGYVVYARFLGGIDGLPALPEVYLHTTRPNDDPAPVQQPTNNTDEKLRMAFGEDCLELTYPIKLEVRSKGMVLASKAFKIEDTGERAGQVRLNCLSLALFGKPAGEVKYPEINTVRSDVAYLTFDHPITNAADMGKHKIVGAELVGNVDIINNRRTPQRDDDLNVFTPGPLYYNETDHHIWTNAAVELKDLQTKPEPQKINGMGMDLYLTTEAPKPETAHPQAVAEAPPPPAAKHGHRNHDPETAQAAAPKAPHHSAPKPKTDNISGVERVVLRQDVTMHLFVDANSSFPGAGKDEKNKKPAEKKAAAEPEKAHIVIETQGQFVYEVDKAHASFNVSNHPGNYPNRVSVSRLREFGKYDALDCERLELQFHPKDTNAPKTVNEDRTVDLQIETAHATGKEVILKSDDEILEAYGNDFFYDARTHESTLKGDQEMWAVKEGTEIHAREMRILEQKGAQQVTATGPGHIALLDKATGKRPLHARWNDKLVSSRDGAYDLLVLTGDAAFDDDEHDQRLKGDTLKVWLEPSPEKTVGERKDPPADEPAAADKPAPSGEQHGRRPHHVEAIGNVTGHSPDMNIHGTDKQPVERLLIWFKDAPPGTADKDATAGAPAAAPAPGTAAAPTAANPAAAPSAGEEHVTGKVAGQDTATTTAAATPGTKPTPDKPSQPIDLTARLIEAHVLRCGARNELDRLWTEGSVHVVQAPSKPEDKGVDICGDTLQLTRKTGGNLLVVCGDLAKLLMDKIFIVGPVVRIDQSTNEAWVNGVGAMRMDSDTSFQGNKLKEPVPLTVTWQKTMYFDGQNADFHGGVVAEQENSRLLCQAMTVFLDRRVSLKEGQRNGPPAKARTMTCDQTVRVEDTDRDRAGKLVKYQRLECPELSVDNEEGLVHASGWGVVRILQRGSAEPNATPGSPPRGSLLTGNGQGRAGANRANDEDELKLTRVQYAGRMYANNKTHVAIFTDDVHAIHVPSEDANLDPDPDKLPENGMYIHCKRLEVYNRQEGNQPAHQVMKATGDVFVRTSDSTVRCEEVDYDESKDQVIFVGGEGGMAHLYRERVKGTPPEQLKAQKILYLRRTGEYQGIGTGGVNSGH